MNVGIIVDRLDANQAAFSVINNVNGLSMNNSEDKFTIFYKENGPICTKVATSVMPIDKMYVFDGCLIATNIDNAIFMSKTYTPKIHILYMFDLDWVRSSRNFLLNSSILNNKNTIVIAPSEDYSKAIFNYCGRKCNAVIPSFNIMSILEVIKNEVRTRK